MVVKSLELLRIIEWLNEMGITNYAINDDLSVDVDGDVWLSNRKLKEIPIQFNKVEGDFYCSHNQLTSLKGCPKKVGGSFYCHNQYADVQLDIFEVTKRCKVKGTIYTGR